MDVSPVITRLRTQVATFSSRVAGVADLPPALDDGDDLAVPHAFVLPLADAPQPNQTAGMVTQVLEESFAVVVAVANTNEGRGNDAADAIDAIRAALWTALLGWEPATGFSGCEYGGGQVHGLTHHRLWWLFDFNTTRVIGEC